VRAMKAYRGSIDIDPPILNIGIFWRWVVSFTLRLLYSQYPFNKKLGGPKSLFERSGEENVPCLHQEIEPWTVQPIG
jgi:hypothetical protein